ncbi:FecR domain-containing protein [Pseudomonas sp. NPDC007930]|uniref:FecR family protein n=1 Tax=Pseudomonas sp. NPDC007930 TaxID=3364417 RepID=UPI0036E1193C
MTSQAPDQEQIRDAAALWAVRLNEGVLPPDARGELNAWKAADPRHVAALEFALSTWAALGDLAAPTAAPAPAHLPAARPVRRRRWRGAAVAAVLLLALGVALPGARQAWAPLFADYASGTGQVRSLDLPDGSQVTLDAQSAFDLAYTASERRIRLLRGQAVFTVAPRVGAEQRPFVVEYAGATTRALGTQFVVGEGGGGAWVGVLEHSVAVALASPPRQGEAQRVVQQGQSVSYSAAGGVQPLSLDVTRATAWRQGQVIFEREPLQAVVARLQRYAPGHIVIANRALAAREVSGLFRLDSLGGLADTFSRELGARQFNLPGLTVLY